MKIPRMANAMEHIDDDLISGAAESTKATKNNTRLRWGILAACFTIVLSAAFVFVPMMLDDNNPDVPPFPDQTTAISDDLIKFSELGRNYNSKTLISESYAIAFPENYLLPYEKYSAVKYGGNEYSTRARTVDRSLLGEAIGKCSAVGYVKKFDAYKIKNVSDKRLIAVALDDGYYVYFNRGAAQPETLGSLFDECSLESLLRLEKFYVNEGYTLKGYYKIDDDNYIWQILSKCRDAKAYADADHWNRGERNYLSFTATSEALGAYKQAFYITEDGYIWTNVFEYAYVYFIGEEKANDIITYVKNNSTETETEPYEYYLSGIISEIGDGYVLVDDSALCVDPEDGMVFKILTDDLRIRRYVEYAGFEVGDVVAIKFQSEILVGDDNTVDGAVSMYEGIITEQGLLIPE